MGGAAILICPDCHSTDEVTLERLPDGLVRCTCADARRHDDGHEFIRELIAQQAAGGGDGDRGHVMLKPSRMTAPNSRFGPALVRLARAGQVVKTTGLATGAWDHNGTVSYWARPGTPTSTKLTWAQFCRDQGRDPYWTAADRAAAIGAG